MQEIPSRPDKPAAPAKSWVPLALAGLFALGASAVLTALTLGYFGPILFIAVGVFAMIGLQYLLWGWWLERIYRSGRSTPPEELPKRFTG